jgi:hypothetical protein
MCSAWKRCTSTRWINYDYPFRVSFGVTFNFVWKRFDQILSNSSHTVPRLKFPLASSFTIPFHTTFMLYFFVSVIIEKLVCIFLVHCYVVPMSIYRGVLVSITMARLIMCSIRKRCTLTRWIHYDYCFWVSFSVNLQFCLKAFWSNLSNSSHTVHRLKFPFTSSFTASFHTAFVL